MKHERRQFNETHIIKRNSLVVRSAFIERKEKKTFFAKLNYIFMHEQMNSPQSAELRQECVHLSHQSSHTTQASRVDELILNERRNQIIARLYEKPSSKVGGVLWMKEQHSKNCFGVQKAFIESFFFSLFFSVRHRI